ncbi:MAG: RnfABCDGE type electron transport complex subunit D [bacterium]|nr:RnfABCDGE type electron transport complex subunit D [bacterium]
MKIVQIFFEKTGQFMDKRPLLNRLRPLFEALDELFLGTAKTTSGAPHILDAHDLKRYMAIVVTWVAPAAIAGIYLYGLRVLLVILVSYIFGGVTEVIFSVIRKKPVYEGFLVTGLIFPLILPPTVPLWMVAVGIVFGVFFGKEVFGGTGRNIFNPALVGRVFLSLAFPEAFTNLWNIPLLKGLGGFVQCTADAVTSATPLIAFKSTQVMASVSSLLFGQTPGSIGETFRVAIILGGIMLMVTRVADWRIPLSYLASVVVVSAIGHAVSPALFAPPLFQVVSGGLLFGLFFMATDPVTAPMTFEGKWVFGIVLGILTVLIRGLTGFVEGVMFAILIGNALAPLIDTLVLNCRYPKVKV